LKEGNYDEALKYLELNTPFKMDENVRKQYPINVDLEEL
jgi:hypothetical protein